jgi:hypothetical protein
MKDTQRRRKRLTQHSPGLLMKELMTFASLKKRCSLGQSF